MCIRDIDLAPQFLAAGCVVFDLSGAFRVNDGAFYEKYYGFTHQHPDLLKQAVYCLLYTSGLCNGKEERSTGVWRFGVINADLEL